MISGTDSLQINFSVMKIFADNFKKIAINITYETIIVMVDNYY